MARHSYHVTPFVNGVLNGPTDGLISYEDRSVSGEMISPSERVFQLNRRVLHIHARRMCFELKRLFNTPGACIRIEFITAAYTSNAYGENGFRTVFLINFYGDENFASKMHTRVVETIAELMKLIYFEKKNYCQAADDFELRVCSGKSIIIDIVLYVCTYDIFLNRKNVSWKK